MHLEIRRTREFIEVKSDSIDATIFKDDEQKAHDVIHNLTDLLEQLYDQIGLDIEIRNQKQ